MPDGTAVRRDPATAHRLAKQAVRVYNYTNSRPQTPDLTVRNKSLLAQRELLADRFRLRYAASLAVEDGAHPYFIGVFDTVASLANPTAIAGLIVIGALLIAALSGMGSFLLPGSFHQWFVALVVAVLASAMLANILLRVRVAFGLPGVAWLKTLHMTTARMKMYDTDLDPRVSFARHANAIDENRASFQRVAWGNETSSQNRKPGTFDQVWFAGDHSDIGGSYAEDQSRLSDIALLWVLEAATEAGLKHDPSVIRTYPDAFGSQHDEMRSGVFKFDRRLLRKVPANAPLHCSVYARFAAPTVFQFDLLAPYRPENLRHHQNVKNLYDKIDDADHS